MCPVLQPSGDHRVEVPDGQNIMEVGRTRITFEWMAREEVEAKGVDDEETGALVGQMEGARRETEMYEQSQRV